MAFLNLRNNWVCFVIFAAIIFVLFGNALFNGFVYDDHYLIKDNDYIKSFSHLKEVLSSDVVVVTPIAKPSGYYRPVAMLFLMGMYKLWGLNTFGLHLMSLLIHLANTFLVFLIITRLSGRRDLGFLTGCLFALHPIHVEAVTPIFNYMGILASFFSLAAFLALIKSRQEDKKIYFILSVILFAFAMFSKEETIVLPGIFLLYEFFFSSNCRFKSFWRGALKYAWFLIPVFCYLQLRVIVMQKGAVFGFWNLGLATSIATVQSLTELAISTFQIYFNYVWLLIFPFRLSADYLLPAPSDLAPFHVFLFIWVVTSLIAAAFFFIRKDKMVSFFIFFFFVSSFLVSNIIPVGGLFAERFMYLPSLAHCFLLAYGFVHLFDACRESDRRQRRLIVMMALLVILGLYAQAVSARNYIWRNDIILWSDAAKKNPQSYRPFQYLADAYVYHGSRYYDKALLAYQEALKKPGAPEIKIRYSLGTLYGLKSEHDLALKEFERALVLGPQSVVGYYNVGITYFFKGDYEKALAYFQQGQKVDKDYFWVYYGMGLVLEKQKKFDEARAMFVKALSLEPDFKMAQEALTRLP